MDILSYYEGDRRISKFILQRDSKERNLGNNTASDFVIPSADVSPTHLKIRYANNQYQLTVIGDAGASEEENILPLDTWIAITPNKKIWLDMEQSSGYLILQLNVAQRTTTAFTAIAPVTNPEVAVPKPETLAATIVIASPKSQKPDEPQQLDSWEALSSLPMSNNTGLGGAGEADTTLPMQPQQRQADKKTTDELALGPDPSLEQDTLLYETRKKQGKKFDEQNINTIAGRYKVLGVLGKGGMGIVYRVHDEKFNRVVAMKLLIIKEGDSLEMVQRFLSEARTMAKLHHKNIVGVHDIGVHEGMPYFTMDLIAGKEINKTGDNVKPRQAMQWMAALCEAVQYVHDAGIIHRDLKPSNVMITEDNEPILMDFGIARDEANHSALTAAGRSIGTPAYMSPEQAKGQADKIDHRTDVYGLGAILYEMLTRQQPFAGTPMQVIYKVCTQDPISIAALNPMVPKDMVTLVEKAMAKDREIRYLSARDMAKDIERYLDGLCIHAKPQSAYLKLVRKLKHNRNLSYTLIGGAACLALIIGSFALSLYRSSAKRNQQIQAHLLNAGDHLQKVAESNEDAITHYIQATESYTQVLGLDPNNAEAAKGKFEATLQMADHAMLVLNDYTFAHLIYLNALQMDQDKPRVEKSLALLAQKQKDEKAVVQRLFSKVIARLRE